MNNTTKTPDNLMESKIKKVLIVEDDLFLSEMYAAKLELEGY